MKFLVVIALVAAFALSTQAEGEAGAPAEGLETPTEGGNGRSNGTTSPNPGTSTPGPTPNITQDPGPKTDPTTGGAESKFAVSFTFLFIAALPFFIGGLKN